jgi:hypothetical protein
MLVSSEYIILLGYEALENNITVVLTTCFFQNTLGEREREVVATCNLSMFSSLEIKGTEYWTWLLEGWNWQGQGQGQYHIIDH